MTTLPEDLRALALQAITTPLVDSFAALNILSDAIQERGLECPWLLRADGSQRTPLEATLLWAIQEWRPLQITVTSTALFKVSVQEVQARTRELSPAIENVAPARMETFLICTFKVDEVIYGPGAAFVGRLCSYVQRTRSSLDASSSFLRPMRQVAEAAYQAGVPEPDLLEVPKTYRYLQVRPVKTSKGHEFMACEWSTDAPNVQTSPRLLSRESFAMNDTDFNALEMRFAAAITGADK